jgi:TetR/AcrR family transcriptional regulator, transcriptional repressor for nem operon
MLTKAERTKQLIIEKAAPLFNQKGYAGTSLGDIMEVTGLAKGGIYGHFASKDDIAAQVFDYAYHKIVSEIRARVKPVDSATGKFMALLDFYRDYLLHPPVEGGCILLNTAIEADDTHPQLREKTQKAMTDQLHSLHRMMQRGIAREEFRADLDVELESEVFYAQIEGGIMMARLAGSQVLLDRVLDHLKERILKNWTKRPIGLL